MYNKNIINANGVAKLAKGDKLKPVSGIMSDFPCYIKDKTGKEVENYYIFIKVNNNSVTLRNRMGHLKSYRISDVEYGVLYKVYEWTPWRPVPGDESAFYKTNRKRIWYKKNNIKVKCDCNVKEDKFDLETGLSICQARWEEKNKKQILTTLDNELYIEEHVIYDDIINAPFYYNVVNCINTDFGMHNKLGEFINETYDLQQLIPYNVDYTAKFKMDENNDLVLATYKNIISLIVSEPYQKASYQKLYQCLYEMAWYVFTYNIHYLAMCKICCGKNGLEWEKVKELMYNTFGEVYSEFKKNSDKLYDKFHLHIQIYDY